MEDSMSLLSLCTQVCDYKKRLQQRAHYWTELTSSAPCDRTKWITLWVDLLVNILSTLLLGAGSNCAQLLSSPERVDVDKAHLSGVWLDIGVPSVRNLKHIQRKRSVLWLVLFAASIPLHLFFNSVVYSQSYSNDYLAILVTEDFLAGGSWNYINGTWTDYWHWTNANDQIGVLQLQAQKNSLQRLDNNTCLKAYSTSVLHTAWSNVLVVTNVSQQNNFVAAAPYQFQAAQNTHWLCDMEEAYQGQPSCDMSALAVSWQIINISNQPYSVQVLYCLATPFPPHCTIKASSTLLLVVMACNVLKLGCMTYVLCQSSFDPLATIGDAISSFLRSPDMTTKDKGLLDGFDIRGGWAPDTKWDPRVKRWATTSGTSRRTNILTLCLLIWIVGLIFLLIICVESGSIAAIWSESIGSFNANAIIGSSAGAPLLTNVLLANMPQLVVSMAYLFYNNIFTCMLLGCEISEFATQRKSLRTTAPRGQQHSTYWLQLPFRYSIPIMASMAVLHWLISRSVFLLEVEIYNEDGTLDPGRTINAAGYAGQPIILALVLGFVLIVALVAFGRRKLTPGIPAIGNCSKAISAACHANPQEKKLEVLPLKYGIIPGSGKDRERGEHVGFSSREVLPLVPFDRYY